jgi:hypothetical protein
MTSRQKLRLELAEQVCRIAMRHHSCGLVESEGYRPDAVVGLYVMQREAEYKGRLAPGSLHWLSDAGEELQAAIFRWMESVGLDPKSHDKAEAKLMAMELAKDALGPEFESDIEQTETTKRKWVERTADDRAAGIAQEFFAGKIKGMDELRIAIAGEILEAEHVVRDPFVVFALAIFHTAKEQGEDSAEKLTTACSELLRAAWRWMGIEPKDSEDEEAPA